MPRKGGKRLAGIGDKDNASRQQHEDYIKSQQRKTYYNELKQYKRHRDQQNKHNKKKWEEKQLYGSFDRHGSEISHKKISTWLRKRNIKREAESLLIVAQNNAIRTNYVKAKIDETQQNSKCRLCGDGDKTINLIISECFKVAQRKCKSRHEWWGRLSMRNCARSLNLTIKQVVFAQNGIRPK